MWCCFFFKQKTAYELRISDWSSDVCSSDLDARTAVGADDADARPDMVTPPRQQAEHPPEVGFVSGFFEDAAADRNGRVARQDHFVRRALDRAIGLAPCKERVCQYV